MGFFKQSIGPVFLNESCNVENDIEKLKQIEMTVDEKNKKDIENQLNILSYGLAGEKNIAFELKSSNMDMYILHDVYLEYGELTAQIDYIVITSKRVYVIECKNLIGNIEINSDGNFVRTYQQNGKQIREGIYSPVTQNERHLQIIKQIRREAKSNILTKALFDKNFEDTYKSIIVLANPKTICNNRYAKKEIKEKVIRADQLISYIKEKEMQSKGSDMSQKAMLELAEYFLSVSKERKVDYSAKYAEQCSKNDVKVNIEDVKSELKAFRLARSREEKIKPYFIFNDNQLDDLLEKKPKNKEDLLSVSGFGEVKVNKYGDDILKIIENL